MTKHFKRKKVRVFITGSPCTGKTTIANLLGKKTGLPVACIDTFVTKQFHPIKRKKHIYVLAKQFDKKIEELNGIIEGQLAHLACLREANGLIFVIRCSPTVLRKRLVKRKYSKSRINATLIHEQLGYCSAIAGRNHKKVWEINTSKDSPTKVTNKILEIIQKESKKQN